MFKKLLLYVDIKLSNKTTVKAMHHRATRVLSFIWYPNTCGPKGHGSGSAAAKAMAVGFFNTAIILSTDRS